MASLGLGALGAILLKEDLLPGRLLENKRIECLALVLFPFVLVTIPYRFSMPVFGIFSLYFVLKCTTEGFSLNLINKFLTNEKVMYIGIISYGIYVFHMPINYYFTKYMFDPVWLNINYSALGKFSKLEWHSWIIKFPLYSFLSIAVAALSFNYVETPILKLKDRFFKY
jgi:peptidoglycan/LPS O-acetylase OafA/YrhL